MAHESKHARGDALYFPWLYFPWLYFSWLYHGYTYYGAREQHARGDELRLGGAAAVEGEGRQRVGGDHAVQHEDLLLLHCRDQRAVALVSGGWWVVRSYSKQ